MEPPFWLHTCFAELVPLVLEADMGSECESGPDGELDIEFAAVATSSSDSAGWDCWVYFDAWGGPANHGILVVATSRANGT